MSANEKTAKPAFDNDRVTLICPSLNCGQTLAVKSSTRGAVVRCPYCGQLFRVPATAGGGLDKVRKPG